MYENIGIMTIKSSNPSVNTYIRVFCIEPSVIFSPAVYTWFNSPLYTTRSKSKVKNKAHTNSIEVKIDGNAKGCMSDALVSAKYINTMRTEKDI